MNNCMISVFAHKMLINFDKRTKNNLLVVKNRRIFVLLTDKCNNMGFDIKNKISAKEFAANLKATIHTTGKLGFSEATAKALGFGENSCVLFVDDVEDKNILYLVNAKGGDEDAFTVRKSGEYYYVNTKALFDKLGMDYIKNTIIFDMVRIDEEEYEVYKLKKRQRLRKQKQE